MEEVTIRTPPRRISRRADTHCLSAPPLLRRSYRGAEDEKQQQQQHEELQEVEGSDKTSRIRIPTSLSTSPRTVIKHDYDPSLFLFPILPSAGVSSPPSELLSTTMLASSLPSSALSSSSPLKKKKTVSVFPSSSAVLLPPSSSLQQSRRRKGSMAVVEEENGNEEEADGDEITQHHNRHLHLPIPTCIGFLPRRKNENRKRRDRSYTI